MKNKILSFTLILSLVAFAAARKCLAEAEIVEEMKPTPADKAVEKALKFLASQQQPDGSWQSPGYNPNVGVCSLVMLAFMANGNTPERGEYADVVKKGLDYILNLPERDGFLMDKASHGPMYGHGITAIFLSEVYGMTPSEKVKQRLDAAIRIILKAQNVQKNDRDKGGWRYQPGSRDSDISVTGWQLVALRSAKNCDLDVPKEAIEEAVEYIKRCAHPSGGFGYQPGGGPQQARTGTGVLALQLCGYYDDPLVKRGCDYLKNHPLQWNSEYFFYALYHASNAMYQAGGDYWKVWKDNVYNLLLEKQQDDGSWPGSPGDGNADAAGPAYKTAMAVLALSIENRYLPIYQR